ncbi:MAG: hypothetical protein KBF88_14945 [Polyangiaceae bacterium]|nr:hypothetical protein [Polyangiaceae bacterium]
MRTALDLEAYLDKLHKTYAPAEGKEGTYIVRVGTDLPSIGVRVAAPLVVFRAELKTDKTGEAFYKELLSFNASRLMHSSFGLEGTTVILSSALAIDNLDLNELEGTLDELELAIAEFSGQLR